MFCSVGRGEWGNDVYVAITKTRQAELAEMREPTNDPILRWSEVSVYLGGQKPENLVEQFENSSLVGGTSNSLISTINGKSDFIRIWKEMAGDGDKTETYTDPLALPPSPLTGGKDGFNVTARDYTGTNDAIPGPDSADAPIDDELFGRGTGYAGFATIDEIALLVVPDEVREGMLQLTNESIKQCEQLKDRFAIVSATLNTDNPATFLPPHDTSYAAFYYPWIRVYDPSTDNTRLVPPSGHIAGIFARCDIMRGVWKPPANEVVSGAVDLQHPVTNNVQDLLNPRGINCLRDFRANGRGIRVWGARTMSSDPEWKYISVRRLFLFIEESIHKSTQWVVFEPNDDRTRKRVARVVSMFLEVLWRNGAFAGSTAEEAFFVRCDRSTMTQSDIDNNCLICHVGIAPIKPGEFVDFCIRRNTADANRQNQA